MIVIGKIKLEEYALGHADMRSHADSWLAEAKDAQWRTPHDIKNAYPKASILKDRYVVFDLVNNRYRLKVQVDYKGQIVFIKNVGTHKEYMKW
jgi:mRNA interferase HigB